MKKAPEAVLQGPWSKQEELRTQTWGAYGWLITRLPKPPAAVFQFATWMR